MRASIVRAVVLAMVAASVSWVPGLVSPAAALKASGTIAFVGAQPVIVGGQITLTGRFKHGGHRSFVIQKRVVAGGKWRAIASSAGKTNRRGIFTATYTPSNTFKYRALLKPTATKPKRVSKATGVVVTALWSKVSAGGQHTCAISETDGTLRCWGDNTVGQIGDGTTSQRVDPTLVGDPGAPSTWLDVSAGFFHTCGIQTGDTLWCWGHNFFGQLGTSTNVSTDTPNPTPVQVGGTGWTQVSAGFGHTCGIQTGGTLWCWGDDSAGELGDGGSTAQTSPQQVGSGTGWTRVSAGRYYTCGIQSGALYCWGFDDHGELGLASASGTPAQVGSDTDWTEISASDYQANKPFWSGGGGGQTCGIRSPGTLWCWGDNSAGQLGDGTTTAQGTPGPQQVGSASDWTAVSTGGGFTCGLEGTSSLSCWGDNHYGELGNASMDQKLSPTPVVDLYSGHSWVGGIDAGGAHACGVRDDHTLWCWGWGDSGQLGVGKSYTGKGAYFGAWLPGPTNAG